MLKKPICALLVFAIALVTVTPPRVFAQTLVQPMTELRASLFDAGLPNATAGPKSDLRKALASELADINAGPRTTGELERRLQQQQNQQSVDNPKPGWSRKKKLWVALALVVTAGALWVAIKHRCKDRPEKPCPEIESTDYYY